MEKTGDCRYNYFASQTGRDVIKFSAKTKNGLKLLDLIDISVKEIPRPLATVGGYANADSVNLGAFKAQQGVGAYLYCCGFEIKFTVRSFHFIIMKNDKIIFDQLIQGNLFTNMKQGLELLEPGQTVLIGDIVCLGEDGKNRNLVPLQYFLK